MMATAIRVLFVDDEPGMLDIGKLFLEKSGDFAVTTATSAPDAIRLLEQGGFDVIVSDYQMPEMNGIQFLIEVRTRFGQIPFILFTGKGREEVVIQAINSGADFYLQKGGESGAQFAELSHKIKSAAARKMADDALRESEENYRHLIEHSDEAIVVAQDGMLKLVNYRAVEFTGYLKQELLSMSFTAFIHPDDRAMVMERYQKRMKGEDAPSRYAFRLGSKDGSTRWVEISISTIDWDRRPATLNFLTDITERKQADDSLREEQQFSKLILDSLPGIFYLYTYPDNRLIRWNKQHETLLGYTAEEIKGKLSTDLHLPEYKDAVLKAIDEVMEKGQSSVESTMLAKDGRQIPFFFTGVRFEAPGQLYFMGIGIDITERKRQEEALREGKELLTEMTTQVPGAVYQFYVRTNGELGFYYVSERSEQILGLKPDLEGYFERFTALVIPEHREGFIKSIETSVKELSEWKYEGILQKPTGEKIWFFGSSTPSLRENEIIFNGIVQDITDRKRAEEALVESEEKLSLFMRYCPNPVYIKDEDTRAVILSHHFEKMLGKPLSQLLGKTGEELWSPELAAEMRADDEKVMKEGCTIEREETFEGRYYFSVKFPIPIPNRPTILGGYTTDITDRKRAEEALRESESFNRGLVENLPDYIIVYGTDGKILYVNPATETALGYNAKELIGTSVLAYIAEEHRKEVISRMKLRQEGCEVPAYETVLVAHDGHRRQVIVKGTPIRYHDSPATLILLVDITERKRAEEELRESEETFRIHIENSFDVIFTLDSEGIFVFISPAWERHFGYPVSDVIGKTFAPFVHPDDVAPLVEYLKRVLITGQSEASPAYRVKHADGGWLWLVANGTPYVSTKGERQFIGVGRDITERKRAEEALAESDEKIRLLLNSTAEAIYGLDMNGNCTFCNSACLHLLGYKHPDELLGRNMHWQIHAKHPDGTYFPVEDCRIFQAFNKGEGTHVDDEVLWRSDGTSFPAEYWSYPQRRDGVVVGAVVTFLDITDRKRAEEALQQANKQLNLLSDITRHDILNQLLVLRGYLELSHDVIDKPEALREYIKKEQHAAITIEEQITFTRDYQNLGAAAPAWQNVNECIRKAMAALPLRAVHIEPDPADPEVYADPLFDKVFYNLIDNALRYGGDQMKMIRVSSQESDTSLTIICEDDGVGISAEDKKKLFRKGFGKHTGLGLFLSREILAITGITITENGVPGKGARFEITVPKGMWRMVEADTAGSQ